MGGVKIGPSSLETEVRMMWQDAAVAMVTDMSWVWKLSISFTIKVWRSVLPSDLLEQKQS